MNRLTNLTKKSLGLLGAVLCLLCLPVFLVYARPWGRQSVNWSILPEDGQEWQGSNGWTVYVLRGGTRVLLTPNGSGGYDGCEPGETFFLTRNWDVDMAQPVLRIHAATSSVAVWADGLLCYTDAPLVEGSPDTGIALPQLEQERYDPVEVALYGVTPGSELTLAQTAPLLGEKPGTTVYPCDVQVENLFGYERGLIAPAYNLGLLCALLGLVGALLCILAAQQKDAALLLLALLAFARAANAVTRAAFFSQFTQLYTIDLSTLTGLAAFTLMLAFFAARLGPAHGLGVALAVLHGGAVAGALAAQAVGLTTDTALFFSRLPERLMPFLLAAVVALCAWKAHAGHAFSRLFLRVLAAGAAVCAAWLCVWLGFHRETLLRLLGGQVVYEVFLREPLLWLAQGAVLVTVLIGAYRSAAAAREERVFTALRTAALQQSYENLRSHQNEVMLLRHDVNRHYTALKALLEEGQTDRAKRYLDDLTGQQKELPPVVNSANELVNILLNSRVAQARQLGLQVEIERMNVPAHLPLSDAEIVSLVLNIVDNAIEAAQKAEKQPGLLRLSMNCKNGYLTFSCENSAPVHPEKTTQSPYHGYGLRIVERILTPYGKLMTTRQEMGSYHVTIALPLAGVQS